ncbi:hypothetical protein [Streptomyces sp. NRRL S-378]|nr:hypothetical protein [Streptomyces sp. NRRL S-378]
MGFASVGSVLAVLLTAERIRHAALLQEWAAAMRASVVPAA